MTNKASNEELLQTLQRMERLARLSDSRFRIPFTQIRFGLDALIGLVPIVGEFVGLLISLYILSEASRIGAPGHIKRKMLRNIIVDFLIGLVPIAGDIADLAYKANLRNMRLLVEYIEQEQNRRSGLVPARRPGKILLITLLISSILLCIWMSLAVYHALLTP